MALAALSPNSLVASPVQVNQQVKSNLQLTSPQVSQDTQKAVKAAQTDTITISAQALKMTDDKNAVAKKVADKNDEQKTMQLAANTASIAKNDTQRSAVKAYEAVSVN